MAHQTVRTPQGAIAVSRTGRGPTVVLVHGVPGSRRAWDDVVPHLAESHDIVAVDLLGFGGSDKPTSLADLEPAQQATALLATLDGLGVAQATLVGHDYGGPVVLATVARAPERVSAVGLVSTNAFPDTPVPFPLSTVTWPLVGGLFARALFSGPSLRMTLRSGVGTPRVAVPARVWIGSHGQRRTIRTVFAGCLRELERVYTPAQEALHALQRTGVPGAVLWGDRDPFFPVEQGRRTAVALGAPFTLLKGAGHFLPAERPAEVASVIADLVRRGDRAGSAEVPSVGAP
jgi:pimeloyl-ACP methyl ester carboxylesterase